MIPLMQVEHFWRIYDYLKRPNDFRYNTEYHLFKEGITPTWEDPQNKAGGKWMVRLKKGIASRYWEDVILAVIGEQFDVGSEVCGAVLSVRNTEDIISIWNKTADNLEAINKIRYSRYGLLRLMYAIPIDRNCIIFLYMKCAPFYLYRLICPLLPERDQLHRVLRLPSVIQIEYKKHQDSMVDKSSYRNPSLVWRAQSTNRPPYINNPDNSSSVSSSNKPPHVSYQRDGGGFSKPPPFLPSSSTESQSKSWKPRSDSDAPNGTWNKPRSDSDTTNNWGKPRTEYDHSHSSSLNGWNKPKDYSRGNSDNVHDSSGISRAPTSGWSRGQGVPSTTPSTGISSKPTMPVTMKAAVAPPIPGSGPPMMGNAWARNRPSIQPDEP